MKKLVCLLLAALLLAAGAGAALADVSAVYNNGKVTVSTDEAGFWEISIDSVWVGRWVGHLMPRNTFSMELAEGEHQVSIFNPDTGQRQSASFRVGEGGPEATETPADPTAAPADPTASPADPTAAPAAPVQPDDAAAPQGPVRISGVTYAKGVLRFQVSGMRSYAEIWVDGVNTGLILNENGEQSLVKLLSEGEHTLALYVPAFDEMDSAVFSAEGFVPSEELPGEALEGLVTDEAGNILDGELSVNVDETSWFLRVFVENDPNAFLTITKEQIQALLDEGVNLIEYVNGEAALCIDLTKITDEWFETESAVTAYCFVLAVREDGALAAVYADTEEGKTEAQTLDGVTLIRDGRFTAVKCNGVY